jgi:hypothetical protein
MSNSQKKLAVIAGICFLLGGVKAAVCALVWFWLCDLIGDWAQGWLDKTKSTAAQPSDTSKQWVKA